MKEEIKEVEVVLCAKCLNDVTDEFSLFCDVCVEEEALNILSRYNREEILSNNFNRR